jgi:hypothetical protein
LHVYTWSFVITMVVIVVTTFMLGMDRQYATEAMPVRRFRLLTSTLFGVLLVLVSINIISVVLECGMALCPENPISYSLPF